MAVDGPPGLMQNTAVDRARGDGLFLPYRLVCSRTAPHSAGPDDMARITARRADGHHAHAAPATGADCMRTCVGVVPVQRLKAFVKALTS
jgi:hypothetical protein